MAQDTFKRLKQSTEAAFDENVFSSLHLSTQVFKAMVDAIPAPVLLFSDEMEIVALNSSAASLSGESPSWLLRKRNGDAFHCLNIQNVSGGCGNGPCCGNCVLLRSLKLALSGNNVERARTRVDFVKNNKVTNIFCLITASPLEIEDRRFCLMILEDISELVELQEILPICSYCKKIRNDTQAWEQVEAYFSKHLDLSFSHGLCPDCMNKQMEEIGKLKKSSH